MTTSSATLLLLIATTQVFSAPQLISFGEDGKLGVNFGGYHAGVGIGGLLGGTGTSGGLFAEAGTPHGQAARAGLGGVVSSDGKVAGGLHAGATAGGDVKAAAGLSGAVDGRAAGTGYATAQTGDHLASAGLGGHVAGAETSGFLYGGANTGGISKSVVKQKDVFVQPTYHKTHKEVVYEEVKPVAHVEEKVEVTPTIVKEVSNWGPNVIFDGRVDFSPFNQFQDVMSNFYRNVQTIRRPTWQAPQEKFGIRYNQVYVEPTPVRVVEKHIVHVKPHRHHFRKTAYIGGYLDSGVGAAVPEQKVYYKTKVAQPVLEKRIDVGTENAAEGHVGGNAHIGYNKEVTFQRNPTFFADIFNIPISTLKAVGNFLGNTAGSTSLSVKKTASIDSESELKNGPIGAPSSISSSNVEASIKTPTATKVIDDIFAIPINTLGAVNKFLENNVPARKTVQVSEDGTVLRRRPYARRRANKFIVVEPSPESSTLSYE